MTTALPTIAWRIIAIVIVTYLFITTKIYHEIPFFYTLLNSNSNIINNNPHIAPEHLSINNDNNTVLYMSDSMPGIVELTDENWTRYTSKQTGKPIMVLLYDSSCMWSALLAPIMQQLSHRIQIFNKRFKLLQTQQQQKQPQTQTMSFINISELNIDATTSTVENQQQQAHGNINNINNSSTTTSSNSTQHKSKQAHAASSSSNSNSSNSNSSAPDVTDAIIIAKMNIRTGYVFSIVAKLGIRAYPTIILFLPGQNREMATTIFSIAESQIAEHQEGTANTQATNGVRRRPKTGE